MAGVGAEWTKQEEVGSKWLLPLNSLSSVPQAARLPQTEQFLRIAWDLPAQLEGLGVRAPRPEALVLPGPLGKLHPDVEIWKGRGKEGWLEPKGSPLRYQGQGWRRLPW